MSEIITGDCLDELERLDENSVEAIVTDPPYGLAFMGRSWDDFEPKEYQEWCQKWAKKAMRVLKPGGHMLAFSGNRTHHRLFTGVEDAGFEIRDTITWHYGSGFPKALDVSKAIDKRGGRVVKGIGPVIKKAREENGLTTRDVAEHFADEGQEPTGCVWNWENGASNPTVENFNKLIEVLDLPFEPIEPGKRDVLDVKDQDAMTGHVYGENSDMTGGFEVTEPATDAAAKWDGFKTALKPATEYVVVARKPFDGTVAENIQEYGTGALNIDGTRIGTNRPPTGIRGDRFSDWNSQDGNKREKSEIADKETDKGRYPANVVFDTAAAEQLDQKNTAESGDYAGRDATSIYRNEMEVNNKENAAFDDTHNGPSRYFYTSKASKSERTLDGRIDNAHPTVKPVDLMEWLVTLVTKEGQTILDPFTGSGTTGTACKNKNREFIGIEQKEEYADIARARMGLDVENPDVLRSDDEQQGLESF